SAIVEKYCGETGSPDCSQNASSAEEVFVSYGFETPQRFAMRDLVRCPDDKNRPNAPREMESSGLLLDEFVHALHEPHAIVLVGGTFAASRDFYDTPIGRIPGVLLNAYAVEGALSGLMVSEAPRFLTFVLDVVLGMFIGYLFHTAKYFRPV